MIATKTPTCIDADSLKRWLDGAIVGLVPAGSHISIIPRTWDAKGESRFFCDINVDDTITVPELVRRVASEYSRGLYLHFYADDVVAAACGAGSLSGSWFWLYYTW